MNESSLPFLYLPYIFSWFISLDLQLHNDNDMSDLFSVTYLVPGTP